MGVKKSVAYEASAGSGKTFMLVVRYLSLLFSNQNPSKILTLTFTNKAANEMQERIATTLMQLESRAELEVVANELSVKPEKILEQKEQVLKRFLNADLKIMTIDSFLSKILRKFSLYVGVMPDFTTQSTLHKENLLEHFLAEVRATNKQKMLTEVLLATKKSVADIGDFLEQLALKFKELQKEQFPFEPLKKQFELEQKALELIEALNSIIMQCPNASKHAKNAFLIKSFDEIFKKSWIERESLEYRTFSKCYTPKLDTIFFELKAILKEYYSSKERHFFYSLYELLKSYQRAKRRLYTIDNAISFSDVTLLVYELLQEHIDREFLYFRLDGEIEHILLDEFQDTSILQYRILYPFIEEALSKEEGSLFFVGDVKQSIYRFRGGVSALFFEVAKQNRVEVLKLLTNYRSKSEIVCFVNDTFREKIEGYSDQYTRDEAKGGYVEVATCSDILDALLKRVQKLLKHGVKQEDIAILCVTNKDGKAIEEYLKEHDIVCMSETSLKLIAQKSVATLLELLKYLYFKEVIFLENFYALSGFSGGVDFIGFEKTPLEISKELIAKYGLFFDEHLLSFLEIVKGFESIEELLFEYEKIDAEVANTPNGGVRVVTIHKSKGLEYKHVIVCDRLGAPKRGGDLFLYDYSGIKLEHIYLNLPKRELFDEEFAASIAKDRALERVDVLNALYVAFTRAKESLFVLQKEQKSYFEILELHDQTRGELLIDTKQKQQDVQMQYSPIYHELYYGSQKSLLEQESVQEGDIVAQNFGTALHYMLEMMEDFTKESMTNALHAMQNRYGFLLNKEDIVDIQKRVNRLIKTKEFLELIDGVCYKEQGVKVGKKLYYIDLLVEKEDCAIVIDYKSSQEFMHKHKEQVQNYKKVVHSLTNKATHAFLCYLLHDRVEIVKV